MGYQLEREELTDLVEATIRRTVNGQIVEVRDEVRTLAGHVSDVGEAVERIEHSIDVGRWNRAAERMERVWGVVTWLGTRTGKLAVALLAAGLIGDVAVRVFGG